MWAVVFLSLISGAFCASISERASCPQICTAIYAPVCGSDGKTYSSPCMFQAVHCRDSVTIAKHEACDGSVVRDVPASCPLVFCITLYDPVCGSDGKTYGNECNLHSRNCNNGVSMVHKGPCTDGDLLVVS